MYLEDALNPRGENLGARQALSDLKNGGARLIFCSKLVIATLNFMPNHYTCSYKPTLEVGCKNINGQAPLLCNDFKKMKYELTKHKSLAH